MSYTKRLIDANEAYEIARTSGFHNDFARSMADLTSLEEVLEDCTTVDAVEVVRCKDCKHYKPQKKSAHWSNSTPYCCRCTVVKVNPDDFCSYGERRSE